MDWQPIIVGACWTIAKVVIHIRVIFYELHIAFFIVEFNEDLKILIKINFGNFGSTVATTFTMV